jgi:hypothetical protein
MQLKDRILSRSMWGEKTVRTQCIDINKIQKLNQITNSHIIKFANNSTIVIYDHIKMKAEVLF